MIRLAITVPQERAELVLAELIDVAPSGVEETQLGDRVEYAIYGTPGELPELPDLTAATDGGLVELTTTEIPDDYAERWREFHKPVLIGDSLVITPPWLTPPQAEHVVTIEPARAFGTGAHATTQLCAELLIEYPGRGALLDVGCGSGVLAIIGALLGFEPVTAFDNDAASVEATEFNAERNGVAVVASRADLRTDQLPAADLTVANLLRPLLLELCKRGELRSKCLIASGLLEEEGDEVAAAFATQGYREHRRITSDGWCALELHG